jgi:hypothetical protein
MHALTMNNALVVRYPVEFLALSVAFTWIPYCPMLNPEPGIVATQPARVSDAGHVPADAPVARLIARM